MFRSTKKNRIIFQILATAAVIPFAVPLVWIVMISFSGQGPIANYTAVMTKTPILRFLLNSVIISGGTVAIVLVSTLLAAYALAKMRFQGRQLFFTAIVAGLMLPVTALIVPLYTIVRRFGMFNDFLAVILPLCAVILPMTVMLTRNYLMDIPDELLEAARIDGAGSLRVLWSVILPLAKPIIAVVVVWSFLNSWNEFLLPLLFLQDSSLQAVTQIPTYFTSTYGSDVSKIFAALVVMCLPIVIAYLSMQKLFEQGLTAGAIK